MIANPDQAAGLRREVSTSARMIRLRRSRADGPHVFAVTSGKGGVGKTQMSANLAVALARMDKRVLLLDADLGLASLDLALGLSPQHNLLDVLKGTRELDEILVEGPAGVHLIPACPGRYDMANLDAAQRGALWDLVEEVARDFDVLLIDTGAGIGSNAVGFASFADDVLIVTTPDPTALRDAYAMTKVLHRRAGVDRIQVIANQVTSEREGASMHQRMDTIVRRFMNLELGYLGAIPRDDAVREAVAAGEPFVLRAPNAMATRSALAMVRRLPTRPGPESLAC